MRPLDNFDLPNRKDAGIPRVVVTFRYYHESVDALKQYGSEALAAEVVVDKMLIDLSKLGPEEWILSESRLTLRSLILAAKEKGIW